MKPRAYIHEFRDRHGRTRRYFRRFGRRAPLKGAPGDDEFEQAYAAALQASLRPRAATVSSTRNMSALVRAYRASPAYMGCKPSTQGAYSQDLNAIESAWGCLPVDGLRRAKVNEIMASRAHEPKRANRLHKRLRALFDLAVDLGWVATNPVGSKRPYRVKVDGHPIWQEPEIVRFYARWPRGTPQRVAFDLLLFLGQRSIDTVNMARNHIERERIRIVQEKTGNVGWIPLHADLRATLEAGPIGGLYLIETAAGAPRSIKGFYNWVKGAARVAGCDSKLSPHGLRVAAATRLIDAGATAAEAAAVTMHRSLAELERYVKSRNQETLATAAILKLERNKYGK